MRFSTLNVIVQTGLALILCLASGPTLRADSLLPNSDFTQGTTTPNGWDLGKKPDPKTHLVRDTADFKTGPAALRLDLVGGASASAAATFTFVPDSVTLSGWTKTSGRIDALSYNLQVFDANWKQVAWLTSEDNGSNKLHGSPDWQRFERKMDLPTGAAHVVFYFTATGDGKVWLDALDVAAPARADHNPAADRTVITPTAPVTKRGQAAYQWGNAIYGGVEYATGIVVNPKHPELLYSKADTGGFFALDRKNNRWRPMMDTLPWGLGSQLYSAESIAVDSNNPAVLYADTGGGQWGSLDDVLKTTDGGRTWQRTRLAKPDGGLVLSDTGGDQKPAGERLVCDPNDSRVVWFGTRRDGLFRSDDGAKTWRQVTSFPTAGGDRDGLTFVTLDWKAGRAGQPTQTVYVGVHGGKSATGQDTANGLYVSRDGGATWSAMSGGPGPKAVPLKGRMSVDGALYVSCAGDGGLWRFKNGQWADITPAGFAGKPFSGVGLHPTDPNQILCNTEDEHVPIFYSKDNGVSWTQYKYDPSNKAASTIQLIFKPAWAEDKWPTGYCSDVQFDPLDPTAGYETDFSGVNRLVGLGKPVIRVSLLSEGREQMTTGDTVSPTAGAPVISGVWDTGAYRHAALNQIPDRIIPLVTRDGKGNWGEHQYQDVFQLDNNPAHPDDIVAAGGWQWTKYSSAFGSKYTGDASYSDDNGRTLHEFPAKPFPDAAYGRIAVGTDPANVVWAPMGDASTPVYFTKDRGKTWTAGQGCPLGTISFDGPWSFYKELAADRITPGRFYLYDRRDGRFYRSDDGGASWKHTATLPKQQGTHTDTHQVRTNPYAPGDVWVSLSGATALGDHGLYHSTDGGTTWSRLTGIEWAVSFSFGQGRPGTRTPALYLLGQVGGSRPAKEVDADVQLYRSDDLGHSWVRINDDAHGLAGAGTITGGFQVWGRVFVCTGGRGVFYGEPQAARAAAR